MKPRKAQVKDKGLGAESGDLRLNALRFHLKAEGIARFQWKRVVGCPG